jgi:glycerophosphoryl diester phosphodiesterase
MTRHRYDTLIAAHRGGALLWAENSMTAFRGALTLPVDQIETDVRLSLDDEPFLLHDATLDRTTTATGIASRLDFATLSTIALKGAPGDMIPHLSQLLALLAPSAIDLRLELKCDADERCQPKLPPIVLAHLDQAGMRSRTTITSFERDYLKAFAAVSGLAGRIWLVRRPLALEFGFATLVETAAADGIGEIALHISQAGLTDRAMAEKAGLRLGFFGANDTAAIAEAFARRASAFTTDRPDLAVGFRPDRRVSSA